MSEAHSRKGSSLELDAAAYFQLHGYMVRRGVKLAVAEGLVDATDIDVLGVRFETPLAEERLIADCKDRKKPQTFERILWTKGLGTFFNVDRCIVVTPRARWQAREFAARGDVEVLGAQEIDVQLKSARHSFEPFGDLRDIRLLEVIESLGVWRLLGHKPRSLEGQYPYALLPMPYTVQTLDPLCQR